LKKIFTILGSGSSLGSPWINQKWGNCNKNNKRNKRSRCCAHIQYGPMSILIDTSPDIRLQLIDNNIKKIDAILYTHEHADQTAGIFEFRPIYFNNKSKIPIYCNKQTKKRIVTAYPWLFKSSKLYPQIMKFQSFSKVFSIQKNNIKANFMSLDVFHGKAVTRGYLFDKIAYISDCKSIPFETLKRMKNLDYLIIDCFRLKKHSTHLDLKSTLDLIDYLKPKKSILTNLHIELDYLNLKKRLPRFVVPAYDGLNFSF